VKKAGIRFAIPSSTSLSVVTTRKQFAKQIGGKPLTWPKSRPLYLLFHKQSSTANSAERGNKQKCHTGRKELADIRFDHTRPSSAATNCDVNLTVGWYLGTDRLATARNV
jgi:hypothetical protein